MDYFIKDFNGANALSQSLHTPEPIKWFKEKIAESPTDISIVGATRIAVTHGDLHGDNLLVDSQRNIWVIDFERCGEGHILQDFIELEADIFNRLEEHNADLTATLKCVSLCLNKKIYNRFDILECTSTDPRIEKALQTISVLRSLALQHTKIKDAREYLYGLLFNMIFRASMIHKTGLKNNQRSLWIASLICHRLDHWDDASWPPVEFNLK